MLFVLPMLVMGIASVLVIHEFHVEYRLTANNYLFFLGNPLYLTLLIKSVLIAAAVTLICLVLAFPFAYLLTLLPQHMQRMMTVLVILPFWTSYLLRVYAWMTILGERGLINRTLMGVGILDEPVRFLLYNNYAVVARLGLSLHPLLCSGALYRTGAARHLAVQCGDGPGARPRQVFLHVMLPLTLPGVFASFIFVFIPMVGEYVTPTLVGGARGMMIVNVIVSQFQALAVWHRFRHGLCHHGALAGHAAGAPPGGSAGEGVRCLAPANASHWRCACMAWRSTLFSTCQSR